MKIYLPILITLAFLTQSCSLTKGLPPGENLYTGASLKLTSTESIPHKKKLKTELLELTRPRPNNKFRLHIYNSVKPGKKEKGLRQWLRYKLGEPPVIYQETAIKRSRLIMEKHLQDQGYFGAQVVCDTVIRERKVSANYTATLPKQTEIAGLLYLPSGNISLDSLVMTNQKESSIKKDQPYQAEALRQERFRLAALARESGYFRISPDDIFFYVDTLDKDHKADIYVNWQKSKTERLKRFREGKTTVRPTYTLKAQPDTLTQDTSSRDDLLIIQRYPFLRPAALDRFFAKKASPYYDGHRISSQLTYLQNLGAFKFVNVLHEVEQTDSSDLLQITYQLTPKLSQDVRLDVDTYTRTGNFLGISLSGHYSHGNIFGGAERLDLSLSTGLETQLGVGNSFVNTLEITGSASISLPFLLAPFQEMKKYRQYVPRTRFFLSDKFQQRRRFFSINSIEVGMKYEWRSNPKLWHRFSPLSVSQISVFRLSEAFQEELALNPRLSASFEDILIWGGKYQLEYSSYIGEKPRPNFYAFAEFELAGNFLKAITGKGSERKEFFGQPFSQFARVNFDLRYYHQWSEKQSWVLRFNPGVAVPYLNSETLPYVRQFFVGGANSLRAFRLRQLGPGSTLSSGESSSNFFDQTGDMKLELNAEYRFNLISYLKGALFVDAGNIWLIKKTAGAQNKGLFDFGNFAREMAIGTGLGVRLDVDFFVIRLDTAWPVRQPLEENGFQWVVSGWQFGDKEWRQDNMVWHLAIGYPF